MSVSTVTRARTPKVLRPLLAGIAVAIALATDSHAQTQPELRSLFPQRAPVVFDRQVSDNPATAVIGGGLSRLELAPEILRACRSDLSDLRLIDDAGAQIPFLIDDERTRSKNASFVLRQRVEPRIVDVSRQRTGKSEDVSSRLEIERIVFEMPRLTPRDEGPTSSPDRWDLVLSARPARFVRRLEVTALSAADSNPSRRTVIESTSVFRLPESSYEKLRIELPPIEEPRVELLLEGGDGAYLEPSLLLESRRGLRDLAEASIGLEIVSRGERDGATRLVVERPPGIHPGEIEISTTTPLFRRAVEVRDLGSLGTARVVGAADLFRLEDRPKDGVVIERIRVNLAGAPPRDLRLEIEIENGDSPPLDDLSIAAILLQPSLVFAAPASAEGAEAKRGPDRRDDDVFLYFGGARAHHPRYDLVSLLTVADSQRASDGDTNDRVTVAARLLDLATNATLGAIADNPFYDREPPLGFAMRAGAELDPRRYSHRRIVRAEPSTEGLSRIELGPEDLAVATPDLADLRLIDGDTRQWAYLFGNEEPSTEIALPALRESKDGESLYELTLPAKPAYLEGLVIDTDTPFFDRTFRIEARLEAGTANSGTANSETAGLRAGAGGAREILRGRLVRSAPDRAPIEIKWSPVRVTEIVLRIEDGDDRPLELASIRGRFGVRPVYFAGPAGEYQLLLGFPDDRAPQYELRRARDLVLALDAGAAELGPLEDNPAFRRSSRAATTRGAQRVLLWAAVLLAVVVLTWLTLRLARPGSGAEKTGNVDPGSAPGKGDSEHREVQAYEDEGGGDEKHEGNNTGAQ